MSITSSAMLVEMNISVWTAQTTDKTVSAKVAADNNAAADAGLYKKNLMAGTTGRKAIADYAAGCRNWHNARTLPWSDRGARLLPTSLFFDYKGEANLRRDQFNQMVERFIDNYPAHVAAAQARAGALFNPADYPSADEVYKKFGFRLVFSPVPEAGDFRVDLPNKELQEMQASYQAAFDDRLADAMREPWAKMHDMLTKMSEKLALTEKTRWYDSFVGNAQEMCQMLTHLNVTNDPKLERARRDLEEAMFGLDIDDFKEDELIRSQVKGKLDVILKQYEW